MYGMTHEEFTRIVTQATLAISACIYVEMNN
jgi:hypothetical protein